MTTRPKARRFRLRLGDDASDALRTGVSDDPTVSTSGGVRPARPPSAAERAARREAAARPVEPASAPESAPASATGTSQPAADALFDEDGPSTARAPSPAAQPADHTASATVQPAARHATDLHSADVTGNARVEAEIEAIRAEGLTGRQLRMAQRVAQRHGIRAATGLDAVRLLRAQGIDPFEPSTLLDIVRDKSSETRAVATTAQPQLPKAYRQPQPPALAPQPGPGGEDREIEVSRIQKDIARRRRRRMTLLAARLLVFVGLPTLITAWYFYAVATPLFATNSEFVVQQADAPSGGGGGGGLGGLLGGGATGGLQDNVTVQSFLVSREAMQRLNQEQGFKAYFQQDFIDPLRRLAPDATDEAAFRLYQDMVQVSYDPTEGIIRMEVLAADPQTSETFARALVGYAEERVDQLTQRVRENQMGDAMNSVTAAQEQMNTAQLQVLDLQERYQVLSSEVEVTLLTQQITGLETQLNQELLSLSDLQANARPNPARLAQSERRISTLQAQIADLRAALTQGGADGTSLAQVQRELLMAESDVATRQMLLAQAMQQLEGARIEANRQVRYLSLGVSPVAQDEPAYPRAFENTALAFLIFAGLYLMISMTGAILREQVTG